MVTDSSNSTHFTNRNPTSITTDAYVQSTDFLVLFIGFLIDLPVVGCLDVSHHFVGLLLLGFLVVGRAVDGFLLVGFLVVGRAVDGFLLVGFLVVGRAVDGFLVVGRTLDGFLVVGRTLDGFLVVGLVVEGLRVVGVAVDGTEVAQDVGLNALSLQTNAVIQSVKYDTLVNTRGFSSIPQPEPPKETMPI